MTFDGSWQERYEADKESCWDNITTSDIVYFAGTKIIGTSPDGETDIHILDDPSDGHGTAVTGAVLDANPDAVIFFVEGFSTEAVLAASNQPLVDIISTSFGAIGSLPVPGIETGTYEAVVGNNKIHTGAADNTPSPAVQDATAGPPWSIGIAGYAEEGDDQKETMRVPIPILQQIGPKSCQITMIQMAIMRRQGRLLQPPVRLEFCRLFCRNCEKNSTTEVLEHLQHVVGISSMERRMTVNPLPSVIQRFVMH